MWLFRHVSLPYFRQHAARTALTLFGIVLGVAAVVASTSVTDAVFRSFQRTIQMTAGRAELQVINAGVGVPEELTAEVRRVPGVVIAAPLVEGFVTIRGDAGDSLAVFGLDLLGDAEHETQLPRAALHLADEAAFLGDPDAIALARSFAAARGYGLGTRLEVVTPRGVRPLVVRGLVDAAGPAELYGGVVGVMTLRGAQRLLAEEGKVDRIDVRLHEGMPVAEAVAAIAARVGGRAQVEEAATNGRKAKDLLLSLRVTFAVAGLVAAMVGFFIIYHTVTVSLVQRRQEIALLSALGVSRPGLLGWLAAEAAVMGTIAAALGYGFGLLLAQLSVAGFGRVATIWLRLPREDVTASGTVLLVAIVVGLVTTFAATLGPAWSVVSQPIARFLHLGAYARDARPRARRALVVAALTVVGTVVLLALAPRTLSYGPLVGYIFSVDSLVLVTAGLLTPLAARAVGRAMLALAERVRGLRLLLASSALAHDPGRPIAVVTAMVVGLGWILADASLIASFKGSWLQWLDEHYQSDLLVSGGGATMSLLTYPPVAEDVVDGLRGIPGVRAVQGIRLLEATYAGRPAVIDAIDRGAHGLPLVGGRWARVADAFWDGMGVAVSENLARKADVHTGDVLTVPTPSGEQRLPVLGVFSDFDLSGDLGSIAISRARFRDVWRDRVVNRIRVWTEPGADVAAVRAAIERRYGASHGLHATRFADARAAAAGLVDDAFAMTYSINLIAIAISFVGVVNFLLTAVLDRRAALRTLHGLGVPARQIGGTIVAEGALLGVIGAALGVAAGFCVSAIIVLRIVPLVNGWHFAFRFPATFAAALAVAAFVIAATAGLLPARLARETSWQRVSE